MQSNKKSYLILEDGTTFEGCSFGYETPVSGNLVFNTSMVGYPEILTDPDNYGNIVVFTNPVLGNYGVPNDEINNGISSALNSEKIQASGIVASSYSKVYNHWNAAMSLDEWMKQHKVAGIEGIDTRMLAKILREKGCMAGKIVNNPNDTSFNHESKLTKPSIGCTEIMYYNKGAGKKIVLVDCGVRHDILRCLINTQNEIVRVPFNYNFNSIECNGVVISNGPGSACDYESVIENIKKTIDISKPVYGIGLGHQIIALAAGAKITETNRPHRSNNQPVMVSNSTQCFITEQNHSQSVDEKSLGTAWEVTIFNMNDDSCEGIKHKTKPIQSMQYYYQPELLNFTKSL